MRLLVVCKSLCDYVSNQVECYYKLHETLGCRTIFSVD